MDYGGHYGMSTFGAPGLLNVFESNLRIAIGKSKFTQDVIEHMAASDMYARQFLGDDCNSKRIRWRLPDDEARFNKYKVNTDLFFGRHEKHLAPEWMPTGKMFYQVRNWCRLVTKLYVDLMMGGGASVKTGNQTIDEYIEDTAKLPHFFTNWAICASINGVCPLQVVADATGVDIIPVHPATVYFKWKEGTFDEYEWVAKKVFVNPQDVQDPSGNWKYDKLPDGTTPDGIIFEERHYKGTIEYFLYSVKGNEILEILDPRWFDDTLPEVNEDGLCTQETQIPEFMLQLVPNRLIMNEHISDYDDLVELQRNVNLRCTQRSRILNVHADPKLMLPEGLQAKDTHTGEMIVRGLRDEVLFLAPEDYAFKPEYLTWDAQLDHVTQELQDDEATIATLAEISPALLVGKDTAFPESGAAYKMKLTPTLNRVASKEKDFKYGLQVLIHTFILKLKQRGKLDTASSAAFAEEDPVPVSVGGEAGMADPVAPNLDAFMESFRPTDIEIEFTPALPQDEKMAIERLGGQASISRKRVLMTVDGMTEEQAEEELREIDEDQRGSTETMFPNTDFGGGAMLKGTDVVPTGIPEAAGGIGMPPGAAMQTDAITSDMF